MKKEMVRVLAVAMFVASASLMAGGCAKQAGTDGMAGGAESLSAKGSDSMAGKGDFLEGRTSGPMRPVYFDYDKSDIREDQQLRIKANAEFLASKANVNIRIEGNCDDRGTNEYNLALGQRRADSAKKALAKAGIAESRMETISFGEEKPLATGNDEAAWSQNRRADFAIK